MLYTHNYNIYIHRRTLMVNYVCDRCGYKTHLKANFRKHLFRKNICPPKVSNIPREAILIQLGVTTSRNSEHKVNTLVDTIVFTADNLGNQYI
jgi:hypothetical protein